MSAGGKNSLLSGELRVAIEEREGEWLDRRAARAAASRGRERPEEQDPVRTLWQRDRDRIVHSKAFRRLKHKTQVFIAPEHDHFRTRLTHTLEVTQIGRTVARALNLNEDLTEAIGLGHDLGHAPFGHIGEAALDASYRAYDPAGHFRHYEHSLRIVDCLERDGRGLNLTWEVRDGILHHSKGRKDLQPAAGAEAGRLPATLEGQIIRLCDRVAYLNHDLDDAMRAGLIRAEEMPVNCRQVLGQRHAERITTMVLAIVEASSEVIPGSGRRQVREQISMLPEVMAATDELKEWMFQRVYKHHTVDETPRVQALVQRLFARFMTQPELMGSDYARLCLREGEPLAPHLLARCVCDHLAGMTDRYALMVGSEGDGAGGTTRLS